MHLKRLTLSNIRTFAEADLSFSTPGDAHDGFNIIVGPNMSGKTTVLTAVLWSIFGPNITAMGDRAPNFGRDFLVWKRNATENRYAITSTFAHSGREINFSLAKSLTSAPVHTGEALLPHYLRKEGFVQNAAIDPPLILYYPVRSLLMGRLPTVPVAFEVEEDWLGFNPFLRALSEEKLTETLSLYLRYRRMGTRVDSDRIARADSSVHPFDHTLLKKVLERFLGVNLDREGFSRLVGSTEYFLRPSVDSHGIPVHGETLSDGFLITFGLFVDLFVRLTKLPSGLASRVCVLIDEIATFLHPQWQLDFVPALRELFPNAQFILTTHSPFVCAAVPECKFFTVEKSQSNSFIVDRTDDSALWTIEQILQSFAVSSHSPLYTKYEKQLEMLLEKEDSELSDQDESRAQLLMAVLSQVNPIMRILSGAAPSPESWREMLTKLRALET